MKRKNPLTKSLYLLGAAIALAVFSFYVLKPQFQKEKELKEKSDLLWKDAKREKILEITIHADGKDYSLKRNAESKDWIVENIKSFDADSSTVDSLISSLLGTKKESAAETKAEHVGLDIPRYTVKMIYTNDENKSVERYLQIGEDSPVDYQSYARWKDESEIFMISKSLKFAADKSAKDFRNKKIFQYKLADLKAIELAGKAPFKMELGDESKWWMQVNGRKLSVDASVLADWISALSTSRASNFAADDKNELAKYGLKNPALKLLLTTHKGEKPQWSVGHVKNAKENKAYLVSDKSDSVYEMPLTFLDEIQKGAKQFRNKRVATFDKSKVSRIHYLGNDLEIDLKKDKDTWIASHRHKGALSEGKANTELTEKIINSLAVIRAVDFVEKSPKTPSLGLGKTKVEIFEGGVSPALNFEIGNKMGNDTLLWSSTFEDPILSLLDYEQLFPKEASKIVIAAPAPASTENKTLDKSPPSGASSLKGKIMKLEKTVANPKELKKLPASIVEKGAKYTGLITFKNGRKLKLEFDSDKAPYTVSNFIHLARNGFYDNVSYHRVIADFVVQGGDPTGTGRGGPGWMFDNEDNNLKHLRGSLSMAHAGRNTNGSQFFIVLQPQPHLDGLHTVFGKVTEGVDELDLIKAGDVMSSVEIFQEK